MKKMITLELDQQEEKIELHINKEGAEYLKDLLEKLICNDQNEDLHLMTSDWGGEELSSKQQNLGSDIKLLNHLKILYWKE